MARRMLRLTSSPESDPTQHALIEEIGDRVWRKGGEKITINIGELRGGVMSEICVLMA